MLPHVTEPGYIIGAVTRIKSLNGMDLSDLIQDFTETCGTLTEVQWFLVLETLDDLTDNETRPDMIARLWLAVILTLCGRYPEDHIEEFTEFTAEQIYLLMTLNELLASAE